VIKRHFLVVGGTKGTGRVLVNHLVAEGLFAVSVFGRSAGGHAQTPGLAQYPVDVSDKKLLLSCLDQAVANHGKLACVVFLQRYRSGNDEFDKELAVAISATKNAIDHIVDKQYFTNDGQSNSIVLVSSVADQFVAPEQSPGYHVGKAGLSQLGRYYALKLGPMGIRVNTVSPCMVAKDEAMEYYDKNKWLVDRFNKYIPIGRMGRPQDIVNAVMFLAGEQASYITGQNILVDGGLTLRTHESMLRDFPRDE